MKNWVMDWFGFTRSSTTNSLIIIHDPSLTNWIDFNGGDWRQDDKCTCSDSTLNYYKHIYSILQPTNQPKSQRLNWIIKLLQLSFPPNPSPQFLHTGTHLIKINLSKSKLYLFIFIFESDVSRPKISFDKMVEKTIPDQKSNNNKSCN